MALYTGTTTRQIKIAGITISQPINSYNAGGIISYDEIIQPGTTAQVIHEAYNKNAVVMIAVDATAPLSVFTNSSNILAANSVWNVAPGAEIGWWTDATAANPINGNVTETFVTNAGSAPAELKIGILYDPAL